jgi:diguanylate cyclase (GGDEF)-like protein
MKANNKGISIKRKQQSMDALLNKDYFFRYVSRLDHIYKDTSLDAVVCDVNRFYAINQQYGRKFGDRVLSTIGVALRKLARQTGGISCRQGGDTFLLYCPHQEDYASLLRQFTADVFAEEKTADKVKLRFGIFANAKREPDAEERFARASAAAERIKDDPNTICGYVET